MVMAWAVLVSVCFFAWEVMPMYVKVMFLILGCLFVPDVSMLEQIFTFYDRYEREGI